MRRAVSVFAAIVMLSLAMSAQSTPRKKRVAVLDFDYGTVRSAAAGIFGTDVDVGRGITDLLVKHLVQDGTYSVIERQALQKVLAEQNFSNSDRANPTSAAQIGKLLGVDAIIVGSITQFGNETKKQNVGGYGGGWAGRFGVGGVGHKESKAIVAIDARIVNIDTGEIMGVADGRGESKRSGTSLLGGGSGWSGFGGGNVDFGSSNFQETIIGEAVAAATNQLSAGLIADAPKLSARTITVEGLVAFADPGSVILNVGSKAGLKVGDRLSIERVTREIKDPASGKVIRRMTSKIATVEVTDVDADSAVTKYVSGQGVKVGDAAKTVTE